MQSNSQSVGISYRKLEQISYTVDTSIRLETRGHLKPLRYKKTENVTDVKLNML